MIKFFRKIRQKLLTENKISKYLIYAMGEIVLVVIGILISLQINNYNEDRKERRLERDFLKKISLNLQDVLDQYSKILSSENQRRNQIDSFLLIIRNPFNFKTSDLDRFYKPLWFFQRFTPNRNALNIIISSGKINIIQK